MMAQIHIPGEGDDGYTMTLNDEGRWISTQWPEMANTFNRLHAGTFQEWNGANGSWQAHDAAKRLGGEILYLRA